MLHTVRVDDLLIIFTRSIELIVGYLQKIIYTVYRLATTEYGYGSMHNAYSIELLGLWELGGTPAWEFGGWGAIARARSRRNECCSAPEKRLERAERALRELRVRATAREPRAQRVEQGLHETIN